MVQALPAPSEREPGTVAGVRTIQRAARKPQHFGRFSSPLRNSKVFTFCHSSGDTPSVTPVGRDSSLREGAGMGCVPFNVPPGSRNISGDFHRPYEGSEILTFHHSSGDTPSVTPYRACQLPQGGSRGWVRTIQCAARKAGGFGRFSSPLRKLRVFYISPFNCPRFLTQKRYRAGHLPYGNQLKA